ncbi:Dehydrogenase reductase SDR member 4 [Chamberlinius hualienensis]
MFVTKLPTYVLRAKWFQAVLSRQYSSVNNNKRFKDKVAVVTASTDGIGFGIAKSLAADGAHVVISSRKQENVDEAMKKLNSEGFDQISGIVCHVGKKEDREALLDHSLKQGGVDILVNNAGINLFYQPVLQTPEEIWDKVLDINLKSAFLLTRDFVPHMEKRGGGAITYVTSLTGCLVHPQLGVYSVTKAALHSLAKVVAYNCSSKNIRVNCVAPGAIDTKMAGWLRSDHISMTYMYNLQALKRMGTPEEIGKVVAFLSSEEASYITGEVIVVSGGRLFS